MAKILVSSHTPFIGPVRQLIEQEHQVMTLQSQFAGTFRDLDLPVEPLEAHMDGALHRRAQDEAARLLRRVQPLKNSLEPGAAQFMKKHAYGFLLPRLGNLSMLALSMDKVKPDLILLHNDVEPLNRTAALWGQVHGVPVLHIPHAVYQNIETGDKGDDVHDIVTATHLGVGGTFQRDWYAERGAKNIRQTGLPQFDKIARMGNNPNLARQQLGLKPKLPVVVYASSWRQDTNLLGCHDGINETYLAMLEVMERLPNVQFVVKLHPRDQYAKWHFEAANAKGLKNCWLTATHLEVCLQAADLVLSYSGSNILLEGSFFPTARLAATQGYEDDPEIVKIDTDPPDLEIIIEAIVEAMQTPPPDYGRFREKYIGPVDGRAGERVAAWAGELCQWRLK